MLAEIEQVLDNYVRPKLSTHEGDVEITEWKDGTLKVRLLGRCCGCPSASLTTEELIAKEVKERIPEVKEVILVSGVSPELLHIANQLMKGSAKRREV